MHHCNIKSLRSKVALKAGAVEYTDWISGEGLKLLPTSVWYGSKQSKGEDEIMLELWRMQSTPSVTSLPSPLWPGVEAPDRVLSMDQTDLYCMLMLNNCLK